MSISGWRRYVRPMRTDIRADVDDELRFHVEMLIQELLAAGWNMPAARAEAERRFGAIGAVRDACLTIDQRRHRHAAFGDLMIAVVQDLRYVLKTLRAAPGFALIVTVTLAMGIGATTAIFTVVDSVLARPLPYATPTRLVALNDVQPHDDRNLPASYPEYLDWKQRSAGALSDVGTWINSGEVLSGNGDAEQLQVGRVSSSMPSILGVRPMLGRGFRADEEAPTADRVAMLSEGFWRSHFAADPTVIGRAITLTGQTWTVVGVFPASARAILPSQYQFTKARVADVWLPLRLDEKSAPRDLHWLDVVGRTLPGLTLAQTRQRVNAMAAGIRKDRATTHGVHVTPLATALVGDLTTPLRLLLSAVAVLLLIACANVANLLLARAATRRRELAVRAALGAGRDRILALILAESVVRALIGGVCGVAFAYGLIWMGRHWLATTVPRMGEVSIDARVLGVAFAISIACGVLFGVVPAMRAARGDLVTGLRDGGRGVMGSVTHDRVRRTLIIAEIALSFMLLATSGLLVRSFTKLMAVPTGFDAGAFLTFRTWLPSTRYRDSLSQVALWDRLTAQLAQTLGPGAVAVTSDLPVGGGVDGSVTIQGKGMADGDMPNAAKRIVGSNYFDVLRARMTMGRSFLPTDVLGAPPVVVVNQAFADRILRGENPIGKRVGFDWGIAGLQTIVGVVADVRESPLDKPPEPAIYISQSQRANYAMSVMLRTSRPESDVAAIVRAALRSVDPALPMIDLRPMSDVVVSGVQQRRVTAIILAAFALNALLLAGVGLYGVISYSVAQRTQELGIRAALGAQRRHLVRLVLSQSVAFTAAGVVLGAAGSLAAGRLVANQLFAVRQSDPLVFVAVALILAAVAVAASAIPTLRATRADPLEALRAD